MEPANSQFKSIFDVIEERSENPEEFVWGKKEELMKYTPEEFVFEGYLINLAGPNSNKMSKRKYVLTIDALIQYKVCFNYYY
jgi:hypothetical protein